MDNLTAVLLNNYINGGGSGGGLPSGGTDGQIIRKDTSAQEGAVWQNVDNSPTASSTNLVESGGVASALSGKVDVNQGAENDGKVLTVGVDGNVSPETILTPTHHYTQIKRIVLGYSVTTSQPADWTTNYTDYYTNTGTADIPVYEAVTGESAPTWEANKYYSKVTTPITKISEFFLASPTTSCLIHIVSPIYTGTSSVTIRIYNNSSSSNFSRDVLLGARVVAAATSERTTYFYVYAGALIPFAILQVGTNTPTLTVGRLAKETGAIAVPSGASSKIRKIEFAEISNGLPADTTIDIWGVTD